MRGPILVLNAGSSSIKFSVFETGSGHALRAAVAGQVEGIGTGPRLQIKDARGKMILEEAVSAKDHDGAIAAIREWFAAQLPGQASFAGVGHRVVHGGLAYAEPVLIDDGVISGLEALVPLAPLHQPHNIAAIRAVAAGAPRLPQVACFDTAFHRQQPAVAQEFALPRALTAKGVRGYGFHGLSYEYIASVMPSLAAGCTDRLVVAHLGNGASMCAISKGRSAATTMTFTAVDGLPMGTRCGSLDPAVILYLLQHEGMDAGAVERLIYSQSGLLGVSGVSSDMRALLASALPSAREAVDLFVYRIGRELGSLAAALQGLDALVFTAGIGEHAAEIRARVCRDARWLGILLDEDANARHQTRISRVDSPVAAFVVPTDENLMIARHTLELIDRRGGGV
ncbi:MAG: acetate/propionate family kinase [Bradyrhizobiaceae bacterium]|nr:acetate/propionate family kinase [Bradyrhizobiaceae bacterium]